MRRRQAIKSNSFSTTPAPLPPKKPVESVIIERELTPQIVAHDLNCCRDTAVKLMIAAGARNISTATQKQWRISRQKLEAYLAESTVA